MKRSIIAAALPVALTMAGSAVAAPFPSYDPVSMATGGTGVAVARTSTGTLLNPAALAAMPEDSRFNANLSVGVRVFDPDELFDEVDDFQDAEHVDRVDTVINRIEQLDANDPEDFLDDLRDLSDAIRGLNDGLKRVSDRPLQAEVGASLGANRPDRNLGVGITTGAFASISATARYRDDTLLEGLTDEINRCLERLEDGTDCPAGDDFQRVIIDVDDDVAEIRFDPDDDLESTVNVRGLMVREVGVTLARVFHVRGYDVAAGITPKTQSVDTFDYEVNVDNADDDDFDADEHTESHSNMNADVGVIVPLDESWSVGMTIRNVLSQSYDTALGNEIDLKPQTRVGVATERGWFRVAVDADVTENEPVGFEDGTQFIGAGAEFDVTRFLQLRGGYRVDLVNSSRNTASAGLGVLIARTVRLDVGVAGNDNELGAAFQLGLTF